MSDARFHHDTLSITVSPPWLDLRLNQRAPDSRQVLHTEARPNHWTPSQHLMPFGKYENLSLGERDDRGRRRLGGEHLSTLLPTAALDEQASQGIAILSGDPYGTQRRRPVGVGKVLRRVGRDRLSRTTNR
jgi:hypothetical protein